MGAVAEFGAKHCDDERHAYRSEQHAEAIGKTNEQLFKSAEASRAAMAAERERANQEVGSASPAPPTGSVRQSPHSGIREGIDDARNPHHETGERGTQSAVRHQEREVEQCGGRQHQIDRVVSQ